MTHIPKEDWKKYDIKLQKYFWDTGKIKKVIVFIRKKQGK